MRHRAKALGWSLGGDAFGGLHSMVGGVRIEPDVSGLDARFVVPADAEDVILVSEEAVPYRTGANEDQHALGVCIAAMTIGDARPLAAILHSTTRGSMRASVTSKTVYVAGHTARQNCRGVFGRATAAASSCASN